MTSPAAADPLPLTAAPAKVGVSLRDFSDRLSPMLVKELRQGLKSPIFTWGLIAMQLSLVLMALISMQSGLHEDTNAFFWWSLAGPVCVLLPMRAANALREETSANTLDTLLLTRLSAWRITLGKWLATCALQILVAVTSLPYLILRYFAGGVNTPLEIAWLGLFVLFGMLATAVMLGLSWFPYFLVRALVMLGILALSTAACAGIIEEISEGDYGLDEFYARFSWPGVIFWLALAGYVMFFFLDLGAARLAPLAENRATRRRLMALSLLIICGACCALRWYVGAPDPSGYPQDRASRGMVTFLGFIMLLPIIQALSERPVNLAPVLMPFETRGRRGRFAATFLLPGWHSAVFFALLIMTVTGSVLTWLWMEYYNPTDYSPAFRDEKLLHLFQQITGIFATVFMPVVVWKLTRRMNRWDFLRWILLAVAAGAFHIFVTPLGINHSPRVLYANYLLPSGAFTVEPSAEALARESWVATEATPSGRKFSPSEQLVLRELRSRELEITRLRMIREHWIIAAISCCLWVLAAVLMAIREMRVTRRACHELGVTPAPSPA